jgi:hypothetical protein
MPVRADTVLHLVRKLSLLRREAPHVVGIDNWAIRKGRTYGTIMVNLERHRVFDLLPDRSADPKGSEAKCCRCGCESSRRSLS